MTYQEFKNRHNNEFLDYDKAHGCQCWDLIQYYNVEVLNVPDSVFSGCGWVGNMILWDWKYDLLKQYFDEVSTTAMQQGDVCIWANPNNEKDCHVAVFDYYDPGSNLCYYFSQDPNLGSPCKIRTVNMNGHHAFRRKQVVPPPPPEPTPVITPNVPRDTTRDQIEVLEGITELRVRTTPNGEAIGHANPGFYNYFETAEDGGYVWYRIADSNWIASSDEWTKIYPKEKPTTPPTIPPEEYIKLKIKDRKDGNVLVDVPMWIKE